MLAEQHRGPLGMSEQVPRRRFAAILAADVVGYSRMIQADEAGSFAALKARRAKILQPLVARYHGRIVKLMGDGALTEFESAVEGVQCPVELQQAMTTANIGVPGERQIVLRTLREQSNRETEARTALEGLRRLDPGLRVSTLREVFPIRRPEHFARFADALRKAGLPD